MTEKIDLIKTFEDVFVDDILSLVENDDLTTIEAVIFWCEQRQIEVETVAPIINKSLVIKEKIREDAESLHFLKKTVKLPL